MKEDRGSNSKVIGGLLILIGSILLIIGWIMNIVQLAYMPWVAEKAGLIIVKSIGVLIPFIGGVLGYV